MRKLIEVIDEMQNEALEAFNDKSNPELSAFGYGVIICLNTLIDNKMLRNNDILIDDTEKKDKGSISWRKLFFK